MERNKPVEKSQPVKEDNLFKHTGFSGNFPIGSTKNMCSIYCLSGITGIFMSMVNNPCFDFKVLLTPLAIRSLSPIARVIGYNDFIL